MAVRQLRLEDDEILRKCCKEVREVNDHIRRLLDDMMDTLRHTESGAALAANQEGILYRLVVVDYGEHIHKLVGESGVQECLEACLSFPGRMGKTIRPQKVTVQALDENGEEILLTGEDEMAKCFCHELEHLDGQVFLDKAIELYDLEG